MSRVFFGVVYHRNTLLPATHAVVALHYRDAIISAGF
jgi:hypothetical protein